MATVDSPLSLELVEQVAQIIATAKVMPCTPYSLDTLKQGPSHFQRYARRQFQRRRETVYRRIKVASISKVGIFAEVGRRPPAHNAPAKK